MKRLLFAATVAALLFSAQATAQSSFATISGTVSDSTGALIPGVTITATNTATNVASTALSNESGAYNLPGLLPGTYKATAELAGFQVQIYTDVQLGNAQQVRLNFTLKVGAIAQSLEVSIPVDTLLATSSPTIGQVLTENKVSNLPLVGNNVLNLIGVLSGVENVTSATFGRESTTFAGVSTTNITTVRDGVMVQDTRWPTGINSATVINPDLVGEIRLILAPVDAEIGRGNGTVQIQTRSGTNEYRGAAVWSFQNTALDPNSWSNNHNQPLTLPDWQNRQQGTVSFGGPIVKNKTFFFGLYDHNDQRQRTTANQMVLTPCARNGIFRYYDNWNNGNAQQPTVLTGATPTIAVVDALGNLKAPATNPDGSAHNALLRYFSLYGPVANIPTKPDCSDALIGSAGTPTGTWDPYRTRTDPTGFVTRTLAYMPQVNNYDIGDGLNVAGFRWLRRTGGLDNLWSVGEGTGIRNQYNIKIDQNFSAKHKGNVNVSYERVHSDDVVEGWPDTFSNLNYHRPLVVTGAFTSTLSPSLVNEARFGYRVTGTNVIAPWDRPEYQAALTKYLPAEVNGFRVLPVTPQSSNFVFCFAYSGSRPPASCGGNLLAPGSLTSTSIDTTPVWTYADTMSWTKGKHSFKIGGELRYLSSTSQLSQPGFFGNFKAIPQAFSGNTALAGLATSGPNAIANTNPLLSGLGSSNAARARDLLTFFSGSLSSVSQLYFLTDPNKLDTWSDYRTEHLITTTTKARELDFFFKDDYKIHKNLTLNLGVRYEYYGVPFVASGLTVSPVGGGAAAFGISGRGFDGWMKPGPVTYDPNLLTNLQFVGPGSPNPGKNAFPDDWNNFGPAVGFAWNLPWFGENKTTVRGGYQITFQTAAKLGTLESPLAFPPGFTYQAAYSGDTANPYLDLTMLSRAVPAPTQSQPMQPLKLTDRNQAISVFDPNLVSPYVQNLTLSVTRSLRRNMTLDVRYVGTLAVKQFRSINLNSPNFLYNGLGAEFDKIRTGGESDMLNNMFQGINLCTGVLCGNAASFGPIGQTVGGVLQTAAVQMRSSSQFNANLANGNYQALASTINTLNGSVPAAAGIVGAALRNSGKFPENFIATNPQFSTVTYYTNLDHNNYHSMQAEYTLRPTTGFTGQVTYTWSKNLGLAPTLTNPVDRAGDYTIVGGNRLHALRTNGTIELPIGPNKLLFRNSTGTLARALERWQLALIYNLSSGQYVSIAANDMIYGNGVPDIVHPLPLDDKGVRWGVPSGSFLEGRYFDPDKFVKVPDPQCDIVTGLQNLSGLNQANPQARCTLTALAMYVPAGSPGSFALNGKTAQIVLQNPLPGKRGNLGQNVLTGIPLWRFDANLSKTFRVSESKNLQFRVDALNVLNHPFPGSLNALTAQGFNNPALTINSTSGSVPFGQIPSKTGGRQFQGSLRFTF
jgi:hypothetical protein